MIQIEKLCAKLRELQQGYFGGCLKRNSAGSISSSVLLHLGVIDEKKKSSKEKRNGMNRFEKRSFRIHYLGIVNWGLRFVVYDIVYKRKTGSGS